MRMNWKAFTKTADKQLGELKAAHDKLRAALEKIANVDSTKITPEYAEFWRGSADLKSPQWIAFEALVELTQPTTTKETL